MSKNKMKFNKRYRQRNDSDFLLNARLLSKLVFRQRSKPHEYPGPGDGQPSYIGPLPNETLWGASHSLILKTRVRSLINAYPVTTAAATAALIPSIRRSPSSCDRP
ncbi:hypothetical protein EVAR_50604_1 [Eumeta japonica]|uniref:Uncharacterized protein n=1 Tax=Eumeta variegata TaxID=151549 RepID=A0A4C1Y9C8_EUMVA|nr:hypothetical protein EVAR_50604_1 [Eumeta japonica]